MKKILAVLTALLALAFITPFLLPRATTLAQPASAPAATPAATQPAARDADAPPAHVRPRPNVAPNIAAFTVEKHPNWRILTAGKIDTTPLKFGHDLHLNPQTPLLAERLATWVESLRDQGIPDAKIPVTQNAEGVLTLSCIACHQPDARGQYMLPIAFNQHCAPCHDLNQRAGEHVPHGSSITAFIERVGSKIALTPPPEKPPEKSAPRTGPRAGPPKPASNTPSPALTFESPRAMFADFALRIASERKTLADKIKPDCVKCHGLTDSLDNIQNPNIPKRWLPKSFFDHKAHQMVACNDCHNTAMPRKAVTDARLEAHPDDQAAKLGWTGRTKDIMLPDIHNCVQCHTPTQKAGNACVTCHVYHAGNDR